MTAALSIGLPGFRNGGMVWNKASESHLMNVDESNYERLVDLHYASLFRFAFGLSRNEADAYDLVQETFWRLAAKGHQLRDSTKAKTWLFTTLYREFLRNRRSKSRFESIEDLSAQNEPAAMPSAEDRIDGASAREALMQIDELYRAPLVLFYLEGHSYAEIAEILNIPAGTVMSRISRGRDSLRKLLQNKKSSNPILKA